MGSLFVLKKQDALENPEDLPNCQVISSFVCMKYSVIVHNWKILCAVIAVGAGLQ